jgi:hypothetical protein
MRSLRHWARRLTEEFGAFAAESRQLILKAFDARHTDIARLYSMYPTTSSVRASTTTSSTTSETIAGASWSSARSPYEAVHRGV